MGLKSNRLVGGNELGRRQKSDYYPTPPDVTVALLNFLRLEPSTRIWEPACGNRHMVRVMEAMGYQVIGTDIQRGDDFLTATLIDCDWIITNPPFSQSELFIRRCIEHGKPFCLLLKSQYWHAKSRKPLFDSHPPRWVLPLTWRPNFGFERDETRKSSPVLDMMWCVWDGGRETTFLPLDRPVQRELERMVAV